MLSKTEKEGCRRILEKLNYPDLVSLVDTTTKKQIKVSRTTEAIKAILEYTPTALDVLKRKKVKRDYLFSYLAEEKVIVQPTIDKSGLIRVILKRWGTDLQDFEMSVDIDDDSTTIQPVPVPGNQQHPPGNQPQASTSFGSSTDSQPPQFNIHVNQFINVNNFHRETNTTYNSTVSGHQGVNGDSSVVTGHQLQQNICDTPTLSTLKTDNTATGVVSVDIQILGEKFAEWFYENLNTHNPSLHKTPADFGPQHFWDDAHLVLNSCTPEPNVEKFDGSVMVSQRFLSLVKDEHLLFNPNLTKEGIYVKSNPHGLVMILVCGTIHRNNECLGVFQQIFGIIKDPRFENNWKIKMTKLEVKASRPTAIPKLEGNLDSQLVVV